MPKVLNKFSLLILVLAGTGLVSCDQSTEQPPEPARGTAMAEQAKPAEEHAEIQWYDGTIEQAFALAEAEQKPLFFYWGAVWCPPCEQIKATVFKHPAFLAKTSLFVPVYLDGDTERAQSWGEHFAVAGYPTMIVFTPSGDEITRIPGWIDSEQYLNVLQLALDDQTSTIDLLRQALDNPTALAKDAYTRLAFYSWDQANLPADIAMDSVTFQTLADNARTAGNMVAWSRLSLHALYNTYDELDGQGSDMETGAKQAARQVLATILGNPELVLANSDYVLLYFEEFLTLLTDEGTGRDALANQWLATLQTLRDASQLSGAEHIASWYPQIQWYQMENPDTEHLPADMEQALVAYIDGIDKATRGEARQNVINTAYQVLEMANRTDLARDLLLTEVGQSHAPYYFMSSLGGLEEDAGNTELAVDWYRRAWEGARGEATRFQWGYQYVNGLVRLVPDRGDLILATSRHLLDEFGDREDVLSGRNFARLERLLGNLQEWQDTTTLAADTTAQLQDFFGSVASLCADSSATDERAEHCQALQDYGIPVSQDL